MILLTGATGTVGKALLPLLVETEDPVRVLVRDPRGLGRSRVDVQLALGDLESLADPHLQRQALRGVHTVIHLAASIRDQPGGAVEELNGLATARLVQAAEQLGVERFLFFSALGASTIKRTRYFRAKALAEEAVSASAMDTTVFAPSIVYDRDDPWVTLMRRFSWLPVLPIAGSGSAAFQPIWAADAARCVAEVLAGAGRDRVELAGPETLTYEAMARIIARASGRARPVVHVPLGLVQLGLVWLRRLVGDAVFATWEEAELMEVSMTTPRGDADVRGLGVEPRAMAAVLGA